MNILSYKPGTVFDGSIINKWIQHEIVSHGSHYSDAMRLFRQYKFIPNKEYKLVYTPNRTNGHKEINFLNNI